LEARRELLFRVRGWLGDEEFRELLQFSRYLGRERGASVFKIDPGKLRESGMTLRDVVEVLRGVRGVDDGDLAELERVAEELETVTLEPIPGGKLAVRSRAYLKPVVERLSLPLTYSREERAYIADLMHYRAVREGLEKAGFRVVDRVFTEHSSRLPREIRFLGKLRDYQEEALEAWRRAGYRGVIVLPTGAGKTVVAIAGIVELSVWSLVVVYTKDHVNQWIEAFRKFTDAHGLVGAYYGEEKRLAPITVTTYQTAFRRIGELYRYFRLIVFDEAHHIPADKFKEIARASPAPYRLGLSATIEREDGRHEEIFPLVGGIVYQTDPGELTRRGYLAPFVVRRVRVRLSREERRLYEELRRRYQVLAAGRTFEQLLEDAKRGDERAVEALRVHARMREVVQMSESKLREVERIVREELEKGSKIIVFTQYKKQAEEIARRLGALIIHGGMDRARRELTLKRFKSAPSGVLVVTTVGDEGLDIPDANVGVLVSGTGSRRQFIQRLGRLLRPGEGKKAVLYEVIAEGTGEEFQSRKRRGLAV
jgi:superfamily II DNA or RNA helicase